MSMIRLTSHSESARARRFDALVRPHILGLYRTAYRYTGRREDAEDLVQDLLVKLYPRLPSWSVSMGANCNPLMIPTPTC
jgi:DNA-directed RNA polymerase specialized sigma24 family protein